MLGKRKKAFAVSINQLEKYIGQSNANKAITAALSLGADSTRLMYRKYGTVYIYLK
jgi:3-methyladenine DNA glycosylase Mpg